MFIPCESMLVFSRSPTTSDSTQSTAQSGTDYAWQSVIVDRRNMAPPASLNTMLDLLPLEIEHLAFRFLPVTDVCALHAVSKSWRSRIRDFLQSSPWDLQHCEDVERVSAHVWLENLAKTGIRVRSLALPAQCVVTVLAEAASAGFVNAVKLIVSHCSSLSINQLVSLRNSELMGTPLHFAARHGCREVAGCLLAVPSIDVNASAPGGETPLYVAAVNGHVGVAELLLAVQTIDVNATENLGISALHQAANGHLPVVRLLANMPQIDLNAAAADGVTPLHIAANKGHLDVVEYLLTRPNIDINVMDHDGLTPLHDAASEGHLDVTKRLINTANIHVGVVNYDGEKPLHCAAREGHRQVVKLLGRRACCLSTRSKYCSLRCKVLARCSSRVVVWYSQLKHGLDA